MAKRKKKKYIDVFIEGKFIHKILVDKNKIKRMAKPYKVRYRSVKKNKHIVVIAYWGRKIKGKIHKHYVTQKIMVPIRVKKIRNPVVATKPVLIYDRVISVVADKAKGSPMRDPKRPYEHEFSKKNPPKAYGLPDGSVLLKGKKPLWKVFSYNI